MKLPTHPQLFHNKSHQDDKHDNNSLTLVAQLNVDADQLTAEQQSHPTPHPTEAPIITSMIAQVNLQQVL